MDRFGFIGIIANLRANGICKIEARFEVRHFNSNLFMLFFVLTEQIFRAAGWSFRSYPLYTREQPPVDRHYPRFGVHSRIYKPFQRFAARDGFTGTPRLGRSMMNCLRCR